MNRKKIKEIVLFCFFFVASIKLIEYQAEDMLIAVICNLFGAIALMVLGAKTYLEEE